MAFDSKKIWIQDWIEERKRLDPNWELPKNTIRIIEGIESDLEDLSKLIGADLGIFILIPSE